jgi:hypothetical protein
MQDIEKKLSVAIQNIADLQARLAACEGVATSLLAVLLANDPAALTVLSALREDLTAHSSSASAHDAEVGRLMMEQRVQDLIDRIETLLRNR